MYCQATYRIASEQPSELVTGTTKNIVKDTSQAKRSGCSSIDSATETDDRRFIKRFTLIALKGDILGRLTQESLEESITTEDETQQPLTSEALTELVHQLLSNESTCTEVPCSDDSYDSEPWASGVIGAWFNGNDQ